jgi:D-alanyl-D-alanine carboxypeptidase
MKIKFLTIFCLSIISAGPVLAFWRWNNKGKCNITLASSTIERLVEKYVPSSANNRESAASVLLLKESGDMEKTLYSKNANSAQAVASTQKIITAWVAIKYGNLDQSIQFLDTDLTYDLEGRRAIFPGTTTEINPGDNATLKQLINTLLIQSSNGAAQAIAHGVSNGNVRDFVNLMNQEVKFLLNNEDVNSYFQNPHGLTDIDDHYKFGDPEIKQLSTSNNMARLIGKIMGDSKFRQALVLSGISDAKIGQLIKVGSTKAAGNTIVVRIPYGSGCGEKGVSMAFFGESADDQFPRFFSLIKEIQNKIKNSLR